jgi:cytochrome c2
MKLLNELRFLSVSTLVFMLISMFAVSYLFFYRDVDHHLGNQSIGNEKTDSLFEEHIMLTDNQMKGKTLFDFNCGRCHYPTDQKSIGPGLANIMERIDTNTMVSWVQNSSRLRSTDNYFKALFNEYNKTDMPAFPQLERKDIVAIIEYIDIASKGPVAMK